MDDFVWAVNRAKLEQAQGMEGDVRENYLKLGGLIREKVGKPSKETFKETVKKLAKKKK